MNLPNKITITRIVLAIILLILLVFPFSLCGIVFPKYLIFGKVNVDLLFIISGVIFLISSLTDFLDGYIARSRNLVTDFGKVMDATSDKVLVNGVLVALACNGIIAPAIPVIIVTRDIFVDSIKMVAGSKGQAIGASLLGKLKTICMMSGITLTFFYNLPFELIGFDVSKLLLYVATVLSIVSGIQYYIVNKEMFTEK